MAVTLVSTPDRHALTKGGRMFYRFEGSGRVASAGVRAVVSFLALTPIAPGATQTLRWNGKSRIMKFVASPSGPNEFSAGDGSMAHRAKLAQQMQAWHPLREDYKIEFDAFVGQVLLTAKQPGPAFNMAEQRILDGFAAAVGTHTPGALATLRERYSIYIEVWVQTPGTPGTDPVLHFTRLQPFFAECDESGQTGPIDIGGLLHSTLSPDWPIWSLANPQAASNSHRKYFIVYGEAWGYPYQHCPVQSESIRYAYLGGADYQHRAKGGYELNQFVNSGASFALRFGPATRFVRYEEPQFLTFINQTEAELTGLTARIVLHFTDDSFVIVLDKFAAQTLPIGEKIVFPVGASQLNLQALVPAGKILKEYTVHLLLDGAPWSELYRYVINVAHQPHVRYFAYLNSLGCLETLATYGKGSSELSFFQQTAERYLDAQYEVSDGQFVDYDVSLQQQVEVATGFFSKAVLESWNDFYRSPNRFRLANGQALPISIVSKSIKQAKDGDGLFAHKFEYRYAYRDDFYSESPFDGAGDGAIPANFVSPGGTLTITQPQIIQATDPTVPNFIRSLTPEQFEKMKLAGERANPETLGFLKEDVASGLFRRLDRPISYVRDLTDLPTTRDAAGLQDVPTKDEVKELSAQARLPAEQSTTAPDGLLGSVLGPDGTSSSALITFATLIDQINKNFTPAQATLLKAILRQTLDDTLKYGAESTREMIVGGSHRRQLKLADELDFVRGSELVGSLHQERWQSKKEFARSLQPDFDYQAIADNVAVLLGLVSNAPYEPIFDKVQACEDAFKEFSRDDFDNTDFQ